MQILSPPLIGYLRYYTKIWWYQFYVHMYRSVVASFRLITLLLTSVFCPPTTLWATWTIPHSINHWNQFEISILLYFRLWISPIHVTLFFTSISTYSNILNFLQKEKENFKTTKRIVLFKDSDIIVKGFRWEMKCKDEERRIFCLIYCVWNIFSTDESRLKTQVQDYETLEWSIQSKDIHVMVIFLMAKVRTGRIYE